MLEYTKETVIEFVKARIESFADIKNNMYNNVRTSILIRTTFKLTYVLSVFFASYLTYLYTIYRDVRVLGRFYGSCIGTLTQMEDLP